MNTIRNSTLLCLSLVPVVFVFFFTACSQEQVQYAPVPPTVQARAPYSITSSPTLSVSGTLQATATVHLAFQVGGQIQNISVSEGDNVNKGQQLAHLDDTSLKNNLVIAEAKLKEVIIQA